MGVARTATLAVDSMNVAWNAHDADAVAAVFAVLATDSAGSMAQPGLA